MDSLTISRPSPARTADPLAFLLVASALCFFWLAVDTPTPWSDAGGYENMLRHFLGTGVVDYMRWSQPTFIGVLALAVPWAHVFGTTTLSLSCLGAFYSVLLMGGLYLLLVGRVRPWLAVALCASVFCFEEFPLSAPAFMTDIPYILYLVWFLVVHRTLEETHESGGRWAIALLWVCWVALLLLAVLTRSFALVIIAVFALRSVFLTSADRTFAIKCLVLSVITAGFSFLVVGKMSVNRFSALELTVAREVLAEHQWERLDLRAFCVISLLTAAALTPALLLTWKKSVRKAPVVDAVVAVAVLGLTAYFWTRGHLPTLTGPAIVAFHQRLLAAPLLLLAPTGAVLGFRWLRDYLPGMVTSTEQILATIAVSSLLVLPVMQHPVARHALPAIVALIVLTGYHSSFKFGLWPGVGVLLLVALSTASLLFTTADRRLNAAQFDVAQGVVGQGQPADTIYAGWSWFCAYNMRPGAPATRDYVASYRHLRTAAPISVLTGPVSSRPASQPGVTAGALGVVGRVYVSTRPTEANE
ncbi:MAG: hypothetical protein IT209_05070 [Armatimonadetes bacterium]|nr:hypothetical protein [Armatimonadota bacterium]